MANEELIKEIKEDTSVDTLIIKDSINGISESIIEDITSLKPIVLNWLRKGENLFTDFIQILEDNENPGAKLEKLKPNTQEEYVLWIRLGASFLEKVRETITGYSIHYLIKDERKTTEQTLIIEEDRMWTLLQSEKNLKHYSKLGINDSYKVGSRKDRSTEIKNILSDYLGSAKNWATYQNDIVKFNIIKNRIKYMESFYQQEKRITQYVTEGYKTYYKYLNESNETFEKRKKEKNFKPLEEMHNITLNKRYLYYRNCAGQPGLEEEESFSRSDKKGTFKVKRKQLVMETYNNKIHRLFGNHGDLYEAVVHGAANLKPSSYIQEWNAFQSVKGDEQMKVRLTYRKPSDIIANIDNMIAEKTSATFMQAGDNYFKIKKIEEGKESIEIVALQTKLQSGRIAKNTIINLIIQLYNIISLSTEEEIQKGLLKYLSENMSNKNMDLLENQLQEDVNEIIEEQIKQVHKK